MPAGQRRITAREAVGSGTANARACLNTPCGTGTNGFKFPANRHTWAFSPHIAREAFQIRSTLGSEGAGNAGCALHPRSRVQCAREVRTRAYRAAESIRHSLRNGFTTYSALSLVIGFLATIVPEKPCLKGLTPAPRRQDHTPLSYASAPSSKAPPRPPQPAPRS